VGLFLRTGMRWGRHLPAVPPLVRCRYGNGRGLSHSGVGCGSQLTTRMREGWLWTSQCQEFWKSLRLVMGILHLLTGKLKPGSSEHGLKRTLGGKKKLTGPPKKYMSSDPRLRPLGLHFKGDSRLPRRSDGAQRIGRVGCGLSLQDVGFASTVDTDCRAGKRLGTLSRPLTGGLSPQKRSSGNGLSKTDIEEYVLQPRSVQICG
jgi:hypothetical protein